VPGGLVGARIGVPRSVLWGYSPAADAIAEEAIRRLASAGATIVDPADISTAEALRDSDDELTVLLYELKAGLATYLSTRPGGPQSIDDVIAFNVAQAERELPFFGQELFEKAAVKGPLTDTDYVEALQRGRRLAQDEGIDAVLRQHDLDALVAPSYAPAWKIDLVNGDQVAGGCTQASAVAGYPIVTVPAGLASGLPVGLAFIGTAWSEPTLLRLAYGYEQLRGPFARPTFAPPRTG
jgi:amidase